jgi:hypothetical protein
VPRAQADALLGELEVLAGRLRSGQICGANEFIDLLQSPAEAQERRRVAV